MELTPRLTPRPVAYHGDMSTGQSCGFAADSALSQGSADTSTSNPEYRLSWHLGQTVGGYRAGTTTGLTSDGTWYKVLYYIDSGCDRLNDDYTINFYGPRPGVQFNMPNTLAAKGERMRVHACACSCCVRCRA